MLLSLRTLDQNTFQVEVESSETVSGLKCLIEARMGSDNIYKVIYQGKLLRDDCLLSDYNIEPKKYLVLMITKAENTADSMEGASGSSSGASRLNQDIETENNDKSDTPMTERKFRVLVFSLVLLNHKFHAIDKLVRSYMSRSRVSLPDQVLEFLMTGTPPEGGENPLEFLKTNQEFKIFRVLVKRRPDALSSLLVVFGKKNPHLLDLINTNKWTFLRMLNTPETEHIIPQKYMHCK